MESHPRATSSVYSASFALEDLLEQITAQAREHQTSGENDVPLDRCGITGVWEPRAAIENHTLPESCEMNQTLEQQLVMQNAELQRRLDCAREHFARLYNAMKKAMEVSRELYEVYLNVVQEKDMEQKGDGASGDYF